MFPVQQNVLNYQANSQSKIPDGLRIDKRNTVLIHVYTTLLKTYLIYFVNKDK